MSEYKIKQLSKAINLELIAGVSGLDNVVELEMVTRPAMELAGNFDFVETSRIIVMGTKESLFLATLDTQTAKSRVEQMLSYNPPAIVFSKNAEIADFFIELGNEKNIPIFKSQLRTTPLSAKIYNYLQEYLAPRKTIHGVLLDINGMGTLVMGKSGIGKSETALELIKRGHQLISDDRVDVYERDLGYLIGSAPKVLERYIEIRGIGIVDVVQMFGAAAFRKNKRILLVVELEKWEEGKYYDRLGLTTDSFKVFNTEVTKVVIPVLPGRNVALLVESAALNQKLKIFGHNSALEFTNKINNLAKGNSIDE